MHSVIINVKPLSVNEAWQGRRFKTKKYKSFEKEVLLKLPAREMQKNKSLSLEITFGFSSPLCDLDNGLKPIIDCIQKKYGINDKEIYHIKATKEIVKKGFEFISFSIKSY